MEEFDKAPYPFWKIKETFRFLKVVTIGLSFHHAPQVTTIEYGPNGSTMGKAGNWYGFSVFLGVSFN